MYRCHRRNKLTLNIVIYSICLPIASLNRVGSQEMIERDGHFGWYRPIASTENEIKHSREF